MRVVIGIGTNLGDRLARIREAVSRVEKIAHVIARSSVYETAPVGPPQPDFLNAAILAEYTHLIDAPHALLRELLAIEKEMGRDRSKSERWGPREIDLDVLWIEGLVIETCDLVVPHPRLHERAFALVPMLEIAPHAIDPRTQRAFAKPCDTLTKFPGAIG